MKYLKFLMAVMALCISATVFGQSLNVTGVVTDSSTGLGVPFAGVQVKGTTTGTVTDLDGNYSITVPSGSTLVFTSIGYKTVEIATEGQNIINVVLSTDTQVLEETIVVAFGTATKE